MNEIISKGKSTRNKQGLGYLDESISPNSGKIDFVKAKKVIPIVQTPTKVVHTC